MIQPRSAARAPSFRLETWATFALSLCAVHCTHPGNGATVGTGNTTSGGATGGSSSVSGGAGGATTSTGGGSGGDRIVDPSGGAATVVKAACGDDPNQRQALPYAPGYSINPADKTAADNAVASMDLATKIQQLHGPQTTGYTDIFRTADVGSIKGFQFRDGPRGVNLDPVKTGAGFSTSFPVASARGATFDVDLENQIGQAMGDELIAAGGTMLLAPTVNILRNPAWGRAQESYGEDSFLLGRMGSALTVGVQQYAPACVKHYAANNVEKNRESDVAKMDEQTLQEVYARHFGMIVQDAGVACVMAAYNQIDSNGTPQKCTQSKHLLTDILRTQYGFQGMVLSDWWAMPGSQGAPQNTWAANASEAVRAGMDMELPWNLQFSALAGVSGIESDVTKSAQRVVETKFRFRVSSTSGAIGLKTPTTKFDKGSYSITGNDANIALAEKAAVEGTVLLKNDASVLPIKSTVKTVAAVGPEVPWTLQGTKATGTVRFASDARQGDLGSSRVNADPAKSVSPCAGIKAQAPAGVNVVCGDGATGAAMANGADFIVVVAGLTPEDEGEDYTITPEDSDRDQSLALDGKHGGSAQNEYINGIAAANPGKVAVVLEGGSPIDVSSFKDKVSALIMAWYPGQSGGTALGKLLFGKANFSGKLPVSWPATLADLPPFSGNGGNANTTLMPYYLGYRWFDTQNKKPLYPFGFGLSYTTFEYSNLQVPCSTVTAKGVVPVKVNVKNSGSVDGDEVVLVFVSFPSSKVPNRVAGYKELKGFKRVSVPAGKTIETTIPLRVSDLSYYDATSKAMQVEPGMVQVMVGGVADKLPLTDTFTVQ